MKKILLLVLFGVKMALSQSIFVTYNHGESFKSDKLETLLIEKNKALYFSESIDTISTNAKVKDETTIYVQGKDYGFKMYKTSEGLVYFNGVIGDENQMIEDEIKMNWDFTDQTTQTIMGFECQKATLNFRGNKFIALYTTKIPTFFGPWKFVGLPGLVLKVYSTINPDIYWEATQIEYPYKGEKKIDFNPNEYSSSIKNYIINKDLFNDKQAKLITAKMQSNPLTPQPISVYYPKTRIEIRQKLIERLYEWEDNNKLN